MYNETDGMRILAGVYKNRTLYRPRGKSPYTGKDVFITTGWYANLKDANVVLKNHQRDSRWNNVRLVTIKEHDYHKKYQNIPKLL